MTRTIELNETEMLALYWLLLDKVPLTDEVLGPVRIRLRELVKKEAKPL